jgi:hypothetical protein
MALGGMRLALVGCVVMSVALVAQSAQVRLTPDELG